MHMVVKGKKCNVIMTFGRNSNGLCFKKEKRESIDQR